MNTRPPTDPLGRPAPDRHRWRPSPADRLLAVFALLMIALIALTYACRPPVPNQVIVPTPVADGGPTESPTAVVTVVAVVTATATAIARPSVAPVVTTVPSGPLPPLGSGGCLPAPVWCSH